MLIMTDLMDDCMLYFYCYEVLDDILLCDCGIVLWVRDRQIFTRGHFEAADILHSRAVLVNSLMILLYLIAMVGSTL